jgi:hypothetical protein
MKAMPIDEYVLTPHAEKEMSRRGLGEDLIRAVLGAPEQWETVREGRVVLQRWLLIGEPARMYLVWAFVDIDRQPPMVVTAYQTGKLEMYWKEEP